MTASNADAASQPRGRLSADYWCVTREDLKILRQDVKEAIASRAVRPTERDPFDPEDDVIGPNVYTVTEQLVKPMTAKAGGMSWALMQHPDGLKCDLFVTHAWVEGTFEIIDKVLASWPHTAQHAWMCFLANPQNANIAALVCEPRSSPFALALQSATYVLVVSNTRCSIYSRLWCAYEAFLAYEQHKFIFMATRDVRPQFLRGLPASLLCILAGGAVAQVWRWPRPASPRLRDLVSWLCSLLMMAIIPNIGLRVSNWGRRVCNGAGLFFGAQSLGIFFLCDRPTGLQNIYLVMFACATVHYFLGELDRVHSAMIQLALEELARDYAGSIADAHCSVATDEEHIRAEIGARRAEVDKTIQVLLRAGMSTPKLRKAADLGVDMSGLARKGKSFALIYTLALMAINAYTALCSDYLFRGSDVRPSIMRALSFAVLLCICVFLAFMCSVGDDRRACAGHLVELTAISVVNPVFVVSYKFFSPERTMLLCACVSVWQWVLCLSLSTAGLENVAAVHYVGPWMAQLMAGRPARRRASISPSSSEV